jgi:hypothetical protein
LLTLTTGILLLLSRPAILVLKESLHGK